MVESRVFTQNPSHCFNNASSPDSIEYARLTRPFPIEASGIEGIEPPSIPAGKRLFGPFPSSFHLLSSFPPFSLS